MKQTKRTSEAKLIVPYSGITLIFYPDQFQPERGHMMDGVKTFFKGV